jgi:hypothetical protein
MKKFLSIIAVSLTILAALPSCKKCYTCQNTCQTCILRDSTSGTILTQQTLCSDSSTYKAQIATFQAAGYNCSAAKSSYSVNYCLNNDQGSEQYSQYYEGNGRYTCKGN